MYSATHSQFPLVCMEQVDRIVVVVVRHTHVRMRIQLPLSPKKKTQTRAEWRGPYRLL